MIIRHLQVNLTMVHTLSYVALVWQVFGEVMNLTSALLSNDLHMVGAELGYADRAPCCQVQGWTCINDGTTWGAGPGEYAGAMDHDCLSPVGR